MSDFDEHGEQLEVVIECLKDIGNKLDILIMQTKSPELAMFEAEQVRLNMSCTCSDPYYKNTASGCPLHGVI